MSRVQGTQNHSRPGCSGRPPTIRCGMPRQAVAQESFQAPPNSRTIAPLVANLPALGRRGAIAINQQSNLSKY